MNVIHAVTRRQMRRNKRRTLVTILGVIISVAMVTALQSIGGSFLDMMKQAAIESSGEWEIEYTGVPYETALALAGDENTKCRVIKRDMGYAKITNSTNPFRPYWKLTEYDAKSFTELPVKLLEGRMPEKPGEALIPKQALDTSGASPKIGDVLKLDYGYRHLPDMPEAGELDDGYTYTQEEEFVQTGSRDALIVGVVDAQNMDAGHNAGYPLFIYLDSDSVAAREPVTIAIGYHRVPEDIFNEQAHKTATGASEIRYNSRLLQALGLINDEQFTNTINTCVAIISVIILIGSVSLIYNAFAISLSERSRYLGMLASVGATKQQKRGSVFYEAALIGVIAIPLGIAFGCLGIGITYRLLSPIMEDLIGEGAKLRLVMLPGALIGTVAFSAFILFVSAWIPALRASRIMPIDAIRQTRRTKLKAKAVKTSRLTRRVFGFEAELGLKNIKRNKSRYRATLISLCISVLLFVAGSGFTDLLNKSYDMTQADIQFDITAYINKPMGSPAADALKNVSSAKSSVAVTQIEGGRVKLPGDMLTNKAKQGREPDGDGLYYQYISFFVMEDEALKAYAQKAGVDFELLKGEDAGVIALNQFVLREKYEFSDVSLLNVRPGESLEMELERYMGEGEKRMYVPHSLKIAGLTGETPIFLPAYHDNTETLYTILSRDAAERIVQSLLSAGFEEELNSTRIYYTADDSLKLEKELIEAKNSFERQGLEVSAGITNMAEQNKVQKQVGTMISVFIYGFIALISLVCAANIVNTISTSVALRKREFAMLKSVGITPEGFRKMIRYESLFYGIKSLIYGVPLSLLAMFLLFTALQSNFDFGFIIPWQSVIIAAVSVLSLVGLTMLYSSRKIKNDNIVDALKDENL